MSIRSLAPLRVLCALLTLICLGCDLSSPQTKKAKHRERAASYAEKGQYQEAIIEYRNVAQADPMDADVHYRLALIYLKLGGVPNLQEAFAALSRTVELDKTNRDAQLKLGELYLLGNEPAKARERADIVLVSAPQNTDGLILKGRSLINEKHYAEGMAELKKAIKLDPKNMQTYIELARTQVFAKDTAAAEATLKQALTIDSRSTDTLIALGDFHVTTGQPDQAEIIYKQALDVAPQQEEIYLKLASFYQRYGKWTEVETALQKLAALKPQDEKPHILLGDFFTSLGQREKALANYQRATEINAGSTAARDKLISHYLDRGNTGEAEAKVKDILGKNNKDLMGLFFDARIRLAKGNADEAISLLQGVVKDEPRFAQAHHFLGVAFMHKVQTAQARGAFTEAVKLNPNLAEARTALAQIHLAEGSDDLAIEQAQAALQLNPRNITAAVTLGDAILHKGDLAKAKSVFDSMIRALPKHPVIHHRLGLIALAGKKEPEALDHFEAALDADSNHIESLAQIVNISFAHKNAAAARDRIARQLERAPNNPKLHVLMGRAWLTLQDVPQAETSLKKAIALDDKSLDGYILLSALYVQAGKLDQAMQENEAALAKNPNAFVPRMILGMLHTQRKEYDRAMAQYEEVLKINPRAVQAANNLAYLLIEHGGNGDQALTLAQMARESSPDDPYIADTLGWIFYRKNIFVRSVGLLKEAILKLPDSPEVQFHYGMAEWKHGNGASAKTALATALKLSQSFPGADEARTTLQQLVRS